MPPDPSQPPRLHASALIFEAIRGRRGGFLSERFIRFHARWKRRGQKTLPPAASWAAKSLPREEDR